MKKVKFLSNQPILIFLISIFLFSFTNTFSQNIIKGIIVDAKTKEPLIGASIMIDGSTQGTAADLDGKFSISTNLTGKVKLTASYVAYKTEKIEVNVLKNKETIIEVKLTSDERILDEVEVVAKANRESENILLLEQRKALVATQAVGAKELSRKGISNAEAAVSQVSGVSKQDGVKNVFVRGLGDRYNVSLLNGFPIPSEDPEYKNISLDFFGTDVIQNIGVNKVFAPNSYGDVGGAIIDITSKELMSPQELSIDLSAGFNTNTISKDFLKPTGTNYFGISNSSQPGEDYMSNWGFTNKLDPISISLPLNHSYGISGGKRFKLGANPLSIFLVGNYSTGYSYTKEKSLNTTSEGSITQDLLGDKYSQNINQLLLANINYLLKNKHSIAYNFMLIHDNNQSMGDYLGSKGDFISSLQPEEYEYQGLVRRQQTNDNLLMTNQLLSTWKLKKMKIDAGISFNYVLGKEPDRRENNLFRISDSQFGLVSGSGMQVRNFTELKENDFNTRIKLTYDLNKKFTDDITSIQLGYDGRFVRDDFKETEYTMTAASTANLLLPDLKLDEAYNQDNMDAGVFSQYNRIISTYDVNKYTHSGYAGIVYQFNPKLTVNVGSRFDKVDLQINYNINSGNVANSSKRLNPFYVLPNMNIKYDINSKNTLRLGLSKTYTLPQSKEISPYQYIGLSFKSQGNENLKPSDNYNADLKWDYFFTPNEFVSLTGFYKNIKDPISRIEVGNAGGYLTYRNISEKATVAGVEFETRKNIINSSSTASEKSNKLVAGLSASYIYTNLKIQNIENTIDRNTELEGAAPFILNFDLSHTFSNRGKSFTNSLVFNYFSDRIYTIGTQGFEDIIEKSIPTLNFVSISKINSHLSVKFKANNILNPNYTLMRKSSTNDNNIVLNEYKKGVNISLGLTYDL